MLCAISGETPREPVASLKTGTIYDKPLIIAHLASHGTDPLTSEPLEPSDLLPLNTTPAVRPRPPTLTSIPALLGVFQEEWDALALETFTLYQQLQQTRQELSTALYQHDAAVRVIARVVKERDEARSALAKVGISGAGAAADGEGMDVDGTGQGLPENVAVRVDAAQERLSKTRRKRPVPEDWATEEAIQEYQIVEVSEPLYPGVKSLSLNAPGELALVGGSDGVVGVYSLSQKQLVASLKGGGGAITDAIWAGNKAVVATSSGLVKVFEGGAETASFNTHAGAATALAVHPDGEIVASVGVDKSYVVYDLEGSFVASQVFTDSALTSAKFHPDGHLLACGATNGDIKVFEIKSGTNAANFNMPGPLQALCFSENGTWLAAVSTGQTSVSIWDMRKLAEIKSLEMGGMVNCLAWDWTGQYLVGGGPAGFTVQKYSKAEKDWSEPLRLAVPAVAVEWGSKAGSVVVVNGNGVVTVVGGKS